MATYRNSNNANNFLGSAPPYVTWTVVKGDTASFRIYLADDTKVPLSIPDWVIRMQVKRPVAPVTPGKITDNATLILNITPEPDADDADGEFTVSLTAEQSGLLQTNDIFDIEVSTESRDIVWTVAQGMMVILEDVTG